MTAYLQLGYAASPNLLEFTGPAPIGYFVGTAQPGNASVPHNPTLVFGWNVNTDGNQEDDTEAALFLRFDANELDGEGNRLMHWRLRYISADGSTVHAPIACTVHRQSHVSRLGFHGAAPVPQASHVDSLGMSDNLQDTKGVVNAILTLLQNVGLMA